jgi:hypothetical protein
MLASRRFASTVTAGPLTGSSASHLISCGWALQYPVTSRIIEIGGRYVVVERSSVGDIGNIGKWDHWYSDLHVAEPYGDLQTYDIGATFLRPCATVEDWGCGKGWLRHYVDGDRYRGVDGSQTPFADEIVDLRTYRSHVDGIFMRHVLEHDIEWRSILTNALLSAQDRLALILFTPLADHQAELAYCDEVGVPDLALPRAELINYFSEHRWEERRLETNSHYGEETVFLVSIER